MTDTIEFVQATNYTHTDGRTIDWIVLHDMEAPETGTTAEACARFFANQKKGQKGQSSAHECVDNNSVVQCVKEQDVAYAAPSANHNGYHIEQAGYARQSLAEWMDEYSKAVMLRTAKRVAQKCHDLNIPPRYCTYQMLKAGIRGVTTHLQCSLAFKPGGHSDPGAFYPIDWFMQRVVEFYNGITQPKEEGDDFLSALTDEQQREIYQAIVGTDAPNLGEKNPRLYSIKTMTNDLWKEILGGRDKSPESSYWIFRKMYKFFKNQPEEKA